MGYVYLCIAIVTEVIGTSALKASEVFSRPMPSVVTALAFAAAFYFLSLTLKTVPVAVAYAIWSGLGIMLISVIGWFAFDQRLDAAAIAGMALIIAGVLVIYLFSETAGR